MRTGLFLGVVLSLASVLNPGISLSSEIIFHYDSLSTKRDKRKADSSVIKHIQEVTVKVMAHEDGSGILFDRENDTYVVATAWHNLKNVTPNEEIVIVTYDDAKHFTTGKYVTRIEGSDFGWIKFTSKNNYEIAKPIFDNSGENSIAVGDYMIASGFPRLQEKLYLSYGTLLSKTLERKNSTYGLNYTSRTAAGMSGGGLFSLTGQLFGIHGQASKDIRATKFFSKNSKSGTSAGMATFVLDIRKDNIWEDDPIHESRNYVKSLESQIVERPSLDGFIKLGNLYSKLKFYDKAVSAYSSALDYRDQIKDFEYEVVLTMRALSYIYQSEIVKARSDLHSLIKFQKQKDLSTVDSFLLLIRLLPEEERLAQLERWMNDNDELTFTPLVYMMRAEYTFITVSNANSEDVNNAIRLKAVSYASKGLHLCKTGCTINKIAYLRYLSSTGLDGYHNAIKQINELISSDPTNPDLYVSRARFREDCKRLYTELDKNEDRAHICVDDYINDLSKAMAIEIWHPKANYLFNHLAYHLTFNAGISESEGNKSRSSACQDMRDLNSILISENFVDPDVSTFIRDKCDSLGL